MLQVAASGREHRRRRASAIRPRVRRDRGGSLGRRRGLGRRTASGDEAGGHERHHGRARDEPGPVERRLDPVRERGQEQRGDGDPVAGPRGRGHVVDALGTADQEELPDARARRRSHGADGRDQPGERRARATGGGRRPRGRRASARGSRARGARSSPPGSEGRPSANPPAPAPATGSSSNTSIACRQ